MAVGNEAGETVVSRDTLEAGGGNSQNGEVELHVDGCESERLLAESSGVDGGEVGKRKVRRWGISRPLYTGTSGLRWGIRDTNPSIIQELTPMLLRR